ILGAGQHGLLRERGPAATGEDDYGKSESAESFRKFAQKTNGIHVGQMVVQENAVHLFLLQAIQRGGALFFLQKLPGAPWNLFQHETNNRSILRTVIEDEQPEVFIWHS